MDADSNGAELPVFDALVLQHHDAKPTTRF
jgi:hypothetical protein